MRCFRLLLPLLSTAALLSACTPAPPVADSREILWAQFGGGPLDNLLLAWGPPEAETQMTDGSRLLTYRHATLYDAGSAHEQGSSCSVSFMAQSPAFRIKDIAMQGTPNECQMLAKGRIGVVRVPAAPQPYPYRYPYPYYRIPY